MNRRKFLQTGALAGGSLFLPALATALRAQPSSPAALPGAPAPLPWERELPLREAARSQVITSTLHPTDPRPSVDAWPRGPSLPITNPAIRSTLFGPAHRPTLIPMKNDVWDRRIDPVCYTAPTLAEIVAGANAPVNRGYNDLQEGTTRELNYGYLSPAGGKVDPYHLTKIVNGKPKSEGHAYPFPSQKPAGQIIFGFDDLEGAEQPALTQSLASGLVTLTVEKNSAQARLDCLLSMERDVYAVRLRRTALASAPWLRLQRHRDTSHYSYLTPDGTEFIRKDLLDRYEKDRAWNGPLAAPTCGRDGAYFWIRQRLPAEKTFPEGFDCVLMGRFAEGVEAEIRLDENQPGLGTPVRDKNINDAPGWAATARLAGSGDAPVTAYVAIVTTLDAAGRDVLAVARERLDAAARAGFDGLVAENTAWYAAHYDRREKGRIFYGAEPVASATDNLKDTFYSWTCPHGGGTRTDMRKYQASAHYAQPGQDSQSWFGLPCYNEVFYTPDAVRNRMDAVLMWKQIVAHWSEASRTNAREMFALPGIYFAHGYLPPIKPDRYVHTCLSLELAIDVMAQVMKTVWDEWDYGGDETVLREIYPWMRDMAEFYAAYARKGADGRHHLIPAMQSESFGIQPGFSHSRDTISALAAVRWALNRAAEASVLLDRDAGPRARWQEIACNLAPYPTWEKPEGRVFAAMPGIEPWRGKNEHPWFVGTYPTVLTDDINLDSTPGEKETMLRTARLLPAALSARACALLGSEFTPADPGALPAVSEPEMLLNSRSGRIHLFPALPPGLETVAFRDFQARGGFLVSAARDAGGVTFFELTSRRETSVRIANPWPGRGVVVRDETGRREFTLEPPATTLDFPTRRGHTYRLTRAA